MNNMTQSLARWWRIDAVGVLALAAATAVCYVGFIMPAVDNREAYDRLQPQVAQRTEQVQSAHVSLASLQADLARSHTQLEDLPLRLEPSSGVNRRLAYLAELASQVGLEVHKMLPDSVRGGQRYDIVPIVLSGSGNYEQVTDFMRRVHESYADIAVVGFDLTSDNAAEQTARFNIGLAWYTLPVMGLVEN